MQIICPSLILLITRINAHTNPYEGLLHFLNEWLGFVSKVLDADVD